MLLSSVDVSLPSALLDAAADLLLGSACVGCTHPGRVLCRSCGTGLVPDARPRWPTPCPGGLAEPWSSAEYAGVARALVLGHKERGLRQLRSPLAHLLAAAVEGATQGRAGPVVLVPVPSRRAVVRERGEDVTAVLVRTAARMLAGGVLGGRVLGGGVLGGGVLGGGVLTGRTPGGRGRGVATARLLTVGGPVADQSGLGAAARLANLEGSMACRPGTLARFAAAYPRAQVVVCDDVLTTGATAREAQRALEAAGVPVVAVATAAATRRRRAGPAGPLSGGRLSWLGPSD